MSDEAVHIDIERAALWDAMETDATDAPRPPGRHTITVPAKLRARGVELRFAIEGPAADQAPDLDPSLIKAVVRAHDWWNKLLSGNEGTIADIARTEGVTDRYVRRILDLAFLAPNITTAVLEGRQPVDLTAERLTKPGEIPTDWTGQRRSLGFE